MTGAVIAVLFSILSMTFDLVDGRHLVAQVDSRLRARLVAAASQGHLPGQAQQEGPDSDIDSAPVFVWRVSPGRPPVALDLGAPQLPVDWVPSARPGTAVLGGSAFRLLARRSAGGWLVAGQSLAETQHIQSVLAAAETVGGPILVLAMFLGALTIGIKSSRPIEEARQRQLEFIADASHELRTPLSVIQAEVALALDSEASRSRATPTLERVRAESERLRRIVEDLLWLARFDSDPPSPADELVDLTTLAQGCADRFASLALSSGVELSVVHHDRLGPLCIKAPAESIDRLLGVLVDNACRYAGPGGKVRIGVVAAGGNRVAVVVEDSGPGIPSSERPRLFDRFHRASGGGAGAGLGLAIADAVVGASRGRWNVADSPLGGARMEVSWHGALRQENTSGPRRP